MVGAQKQVGVVGDAPVDGMVGVQFVPPAHGLPAELAETRCGLPRVQGAPKSKGLRRVGTSGTGLVVPLGPHGGPRESQASRRCGQTTLRPTLPSLRIGYHACSTQACGQNFRPGWAALSRHRCGGCANPVCLSDPERPQYSSISGSISFSRMSWYHSSGLSTGPLGQKKLCVNAEPRPQSLA